MARLNEATNRIEESSYQQPQEAQTQPQYERLVKYMPPASKILRNDDGTLVVDMSYSMSALVNHATFWSIDKHTGQAILPHDDMITTARTYLEPHPIVEDDELDIESEYEIVAPVAPHDNPSAMGIIRRSRSISQLTHF